MPKTQINCPQCRQPIVADIHQLFDIGEIPQMKQIFLAGAFNIAQCPHCGFQGMLSTPLVYHDPNKELLLTFFPQGAGRSVEEQERIIGPMITKVVNNLPQEKRKGYLLRPKTMFTLQGMLETVLEADGITKEMIQAQEDRMKLIQRLLQTSKESIVEVVQQEDEMIDADFFSILSRLMESSISSQDENAARQLNGLQAILLEHSTQGKQLQIEAQEMQSAIEDLQALGKKLSREKLLDLVCKSPSDTRLSTYVRLARPGMDYSFFQMLSERIERARGKGKERLDEIRGKLLEYTQELDQEIEMRLSVARQNMELLLQAEDLREVLQQNIQAIDDFFIQVVNQSLAEARKAGDLQHSARLQEILNIIEELSSPPPELALIEELIEVAGDKKKLEGAVAAHADEITPDLLQMINALITRTQESEVSGEDAKEQKMILERLQAVYSAALGLSMRRSFTQ